MTPEQLAQHDAAKRERCQIETARSLLDQFGARMTEFRLEQMAELDARDAANVAACPHLKLTPSRHKHLGAEYESQQCVACGHWIPGSIAGEGNRDA